MPTKKVASVGMKSKDLMMVPPITVSMDETIDGAIAQMWERNVGSVIVVDATGRMVGIFTERDALFAATKSMIGRQIPISSIMSRTSISVSPNESIITAIDRMRQAGVRHLPVVQKGGTPVGMISLRDTLDVSGPVMKLVFQSVGRTRKKS